MTTASRLPGPAQALIDRRYSCRTYLERPISADDKARLLALMTARTLGPLGSQARFGLLAAAPDDSQALRRLGTYGFIKGATGYIVGAVGRAPKDLEDYGYLLEEIVLFATGLGLGTCWLGGTFTRSTFVRRFGGLERDETQPWRVVRCERRGGGIDWHFHLQRTRGYGGTLFKLVRIADLQRVDLGIAMCHFELIARESGLDGTWVVEDPGLVVLDHGVEYVATWREAG